MIKNLFLLLTVIFIFTACSSKTQQINTQKTIKENTLISSKTTTLKTYETTSKIEKKNINNIQNVSLKEDTNIDMNDALMDFYYEWRNVRYKLGGNSKKGIDCSAFTQRIFKEKFFTNIPRTTRTQVKIGKKIKKSQLELGDLVFFKTGKRDRHVGVYMGNGSFMHASIKGVKFTKLNKPFYKKAYWTSRRVLF